MLLCISVELHLLTAASCPPSYSRYGPLASVATFDSLKNVPRCFGGSINGGKEPMVLTRGAS
jgi:hypothetical protein